jgi:glutamine synthetase
MIIEHSLFDLSAHPRLDMPHGAGPEALRDLLRDHGVRFLRLLFTDVLGATKYLEVTEREFDGALAGESMFDGSAVAGFARLEESDMQLRPDPATLRLLPWGGPANRTASLVCDVYRTDGDPFEGDPRGALKRVLHEVDELGFAAKVGIEAKFFLFRRSATGEAVVQPHDSAGYLDPAPADLGVAARRDMVNVLDALGFDVLASHHEIAPGQHEIDFRFDDALATADKLVLFKSVVRQVAHRHGLHATFMPKPMQGINGSGLHFHQSLRAEDSNAFSDPEATQGLSEIMRFYIGGLLKHARGFCAITNPLVNSYKRLVPGYEAPLHVAWALQNRSALIRVPAPRGEATRLELRLPDPAANAYLALAVQLAAGIDGIRNRLEPGEPIHQDIAAMSARERQRLKIARLPRSLVEALDLLEEDRVVRAALGEHIYGYFVQSKRREWRDYTDRVHPWEVEHYLNL